MAAHVSVATTTNTVTSRTSQYFHICSLILAGLAALFIYYNDAMTAGAVIIINGVLSAIGAYIASPTIITTQGVNQS